MTDLFRPISSTSTITLNESVGIGAEDRIPAMRLYCTSMVVGYTPVWCLQVRTFVSLVNGAKSKKFIAACASLHVEDMRALRDTIDALLKEAADVGAIEAP